MCDNIVYILQHKQSSCRDLLYGMYHLMWLYCMYVDKVGHTVYIQLYIKRCAISNIVTFCNEIKIRQLRFAI